MDRAMGSDEKFDQVEAKRRFEAALRGSREAAHVAMKDVPPKRAKRKVGAKAKRSPATKPDPGR